MIISTNVIFLTTVLKMISNYYNTLKMFIIIEKRYNDAIFGCKDIKCESCGKLFTQAGNMRRHIKTLLQLFMKKLNCNKKNLPKDIF